MLKIFFLLIFISLSVESSGFGFRNLYRFRDNDDSLDLIRDAGYQGEAHTVETGDRKWTLKMHRIRPKRSNGKHPVFLFHGLFAASADYLITGKNNALAFLLADHGYDVWMGNCRGNRHAVANYKTNDFSNIWSFSFNEMGLFDLPSMIDYMLKTTGASKLFYVGHSQV